MQREFDKLGPDEFRRRLLAGSFGERESPNRGVAEAVLKEHEERVEAEQSAEALRVAARANRIAVAAVLVAIGSLLVAILKG
jgi:hypothetical protein